MAEAPAVNAQIAQHLQEQNERALMHDQCVKVEPCDGSDPTLVKRFLRDLELVPIQLRFEVFERTARDSLLREGIFWFRQNVDRPWPAFKMHIIQSFVSQDTDGVMKKELYKIVRQPYETIVSYNRRFRDLTNEAYPREVDANGAFLPRNPDQTELLIKTYAGGLKDRNLATRIVTPDWPNTLEEAMERAALTEKKIENVQRLGYPEPMEIDVLHEKAGNRTQKADTHNLELHNLKSLYGKLESKVDKFIKAVESTKPQQGQREYVPKQQNKAQIRCYYCDKPGHIQRDCRKKKWEQGKGVKKSISPAQTSQ